MRTDSRCCPICGRKKLQALSKDAAQPMAYYGVVASPNLSQSFTRRVQSSEMCHCEEQQPTERHKSFFKRG